MAISIISQPQNLTPAIFYVYLHIKADTGEPFYVGKGKANRYKIKSHRSKHWKNIVAKHNYDIIFLETDLTEQEAFEKETYWINRIGRRDLGNGPLVNFTNGGDGESGRIAWNKGKKCEQLSGINNSFYGKTHTNETKKQISETKKGCISHMSGKHHSDETKLKISNSNKGRVLHNKSKLMLDLETGIYYDSITEAYIAKNITRGKFREMLNNKTTKIIIV